jgi:hypothetical protein
MEFENEFVRMQWGVNALELLHNAVAASGSV